VIDQFDWRLEMAKRWGALTMNFERENPLRRLTKGTGGRGVDVAVEAAWADHSVEEAAESLRLGGRLVLVGIPSDDRLSLKHSTARRKGLTVLMSRRMKHVYPRAIQLAVGGRIDFAGLVSHRFPLRRAGEAFALNAAYQDNVVKIIIDS